MGFVIDETGMCVVNKESIDQRISSMDEEELKYVFDVSSPFLTHLIRLAHCPDANKVKDAAFNMLRLLLNNIFDTNSMKNKFISYKSMQDLATEGSSSKNVGEAIMSSVMGSLDPIAILTIILDDNGTGEENDTLSKSMDGILSVLAGYNPLKLDDFIMLEKCNEGQGCAACSSLQHTLKNINPSHGHTQSPDEALLYLLRCLNHRRLNFGGDIEFAKASPICVQNGNNPRFIIVPLKNLLLNCVDVLAGDAATRTLTNISRGDCRGTDVVYSDSNEMWVGSLRERVERLTLHDRAYISHVYAFLIFSRHRQQTGDCIKQFLYTIFARFLYSATEILFCANENASKEVDGGKFLDYVKAWTNTSVMSSTLNTMKAYQLWRNEDFSAAPVLNLFSGQWKKHYNNSEVLARVGADMANFICSMASPTRLGSGGGDGSGRGNGGRNNTTTSGLDSVRSVRQAEKYIPYGFVEPYKNSFKILTTGIGPFARNHSNGNNIPCNCFHILSQIEGGEILGSTTVAVNQAAFEKTIAPGYVENGTGNTMGLITAYIDKTILGSEFPDSPSDFEKRVHKFMRDIIFNKKMIHEETVNHCKTVPHSRMLASFTTTQGIARCFDTRIYTLFLLWQRPCVEYPNVSALTASQLELMLSRDPKWAEFITRIFFIMERVSFQLADAIVKNVNEGCHNDNNNNDNNNNSGGLGAVLKLLLPSNLKDAGAAKKLIDSSLKTVSKDWTMATATATAVSANGAKAQYTSKLYDLLYEIVIKNDMDPAYVITYSYFLCNYVKFMDELLMKTIQRGE
uniref:Wsv332-like protein n=1 Tax=Metopaulias depressus WSSV-like virus TaxID=1675544 RepID=A0A0K0VLT7_9VIRU|nr:wsv332-like protein [Metopaulias depressus WSSV-like virus]